MIVNVEHRVPPNFTFEIDDFETEWLYKTKFDYIHGRELEGCVADVERLFRQAFEHLNPGGYFEFNGSYASYFSDDGTDRKAKHLHLLTKYLCLAGEKFGKSFDTLS